MLGFSQIYSSFLSGTPRGYFQKIPRIYKSEEPNKKTGTDKVRLKCNCVNGSFVNGVREPILFIFDLGKPPGHEIYKTARMIFPKEQTNRICLI